MHILILFRSVSLYDKDILYAHNLYGKKTITNILFFDNSITHPTRSGHDQATLAELLYREFKLCLKLSIRKLSRTYLYFEKIIYVGNKLIRPPVFFRARNT